MVDRNISLAYLLAFTQKAWFWLGVWVFYYLLFTGYAGIGLLETVLVVTFTLTEIPTGAVADLLGRKNTLILSFFLGGLGNIFMGLAPNFSFLAASICLAAVGGTFYSGTLEALVYDSLKQLNQSSRYAQTISRLNAVHLISPAICGAIGGFLYTVSPGLPFLAAGVMCFIGAAASLFLIEPRIDSEKFTFKNFLAQNRHGFIQLFRTVEIKKQTLLMLSVGFVVVIADEMINSFLGVEFGFSPSAIGLYWSLIYLLSAAGSIVTPAISSRFGDLTTIILAGGVIALSLAASPLLGLVLGAASLLVRSVFQAVYYNTVSLTINYHTESKYRATTLSSFNMLRNIPYVLTAFVIGTLADTFSAKTIAVYLGLFLLILLITQFPGIKNSKINPSSV